MDLTLEHLRLSCPDLTEVLAAARRCLSVWRDFDAEFESRLKETMGQKLAHPASTLDIGWEQNPWVSPVDGRWRIGALGFVFLSLSDESQRDQIKFHAGNSGDPTWDFRLGDSSIWLLRGQLPVPEPGSSVRLQEIVTTLRMDSTLRRAYMLARDWEVAIRAKTNSTRSELGSVQIEQEPCYRCDSFWLLPPASG